MKRQISYGFLRPLPFKTGKQAAGRHGQNEVNQACRDEGLSDAVVFRIGCIGPVHELGRGNDGSQ